MFGTIEIIDNPQIINIDPLSNITTPLLNLTINNSPSLTNLEGLRNIESFGSVQLQGISSLETLNVLSGKSINEILLVGNDALINLDGLDGFVNQSNFFTISGNTNLTDFCSLVDPFQNLMQPIPNYNVQNNAYNPTQQDIIDGNCSI